MLQSLMNVNLHVFLSILFGVLILSGAVGLSLNSFTKPDGSWNVKGTFAIILSFATLLAGIVGMAARFDERVKTISNEVTDLKADGTKLTWKFPENMTVVPLWVAVKIEQPDGKFYTDVVQGNCLEYSSKAVETGISASVWYGSGNGPSSPATIPVPSKAGAAPASPSPASKPAPKTK